MSPNTTCERCGAHLATSGPTAGQCPRCLLEAGMGEGGLFVVSGGATATAPEPQELAEHFPELDIVELLGQGGMGTVYRVIERELGRASALKIMTSESAQRPGFVERFQREARAMASLSHPNLLTLYRFGQAGPHCFLLSELVEGADLRQLIRERRLAPRQALSIVGQLCDALQYAHDQGVVHRDIKPENVLVDRRGQIKVLDFGLAKLTEQDSPGLTLTGQAMGTPHYMAPEQWESPLEVDHRADLYSLGVVLYELLTGELPVGRFPLPSDRVQVDVRLDEVVLRALEKEPDRRYQAASEIGTAVSKVAEAEQPMRHAPRSSAGSGVFRLGGWRTVAFVIGNLIILATIVWNLIEVRSYRTAQGVVQIPEGANQLLIEREDHPQASEAARARESLHLDNEHPALTEDWTTGELALLPMPLTGPWTGSAQWRIPPPAARGIMTLDETGGIGQMFSISPGSAAAEIFERLHYDYLTLEAQNTSFSREVIAGVEFLRIDIQPFAADASQLLAAAEASFLLEASTSRSGGPIAELDDYDREQLARRAFSLDCLPAGQRPVTVVCAFPDGLDDPRRGSADYPEGWVMTRLMSGEFQEVKRSTGWNSEFVSFGQEALRLLDMWSPIEPLYDSEELRIPDSYAVTLGLDYDEYHALEEELRVITEDYRKLELEATSVSYLGNSVQVMIEPFEAERAALIARIDATLESYILPGPLDHFGARDMLDIRHVLRAGDGILVLESSPDPLGGLRITRYGMLYGVEVNEAGTFNSISEYDSPYRELFEDRVAAARAEEERERLAQPESPPPFLNAEPAPEPAPFEELDPEDPAAGVVDWSMPQDSRIFMRDLYGPGDEDGVVYRAEAVRGLSRDLGDAIRFGDHDVAAILLDALRHQNCVQLGGTGARADMRDAEGTPFVVLAAEQTSHETLEVLLSKTTDPSTGRTRLDLEMFDEDVPRSDGGQAKKGYAALATAIMAGCEQSVRLLMNHGADISRGVYGETALYSVLRAEMGGLVDDFLEREPDLSRGKELYVVYSDPEDRVLLERLLDAGAPIDAAPNGWTILQSAVTGEDTELVRFLLERGADPTLQTQSSPSAIEIATEEGLTDILGLLQQAAAGPNATSEEPAWELKLPTAQACEPIMRAPSPTPRADARSTEDEWQPERRRPGHWMPIVHISLDGEVVQSGDSVYDFEDPDPAEFARLQQRLVNMARRMTPEFNEALQTDLPDDALVIRADERTPFAYVSHLMEACARPEVRIWKLEFAVQRAVLGDETPQECRISVHLPIDSGEPSFELRVSADVLVEGRPRQDPERSQDGEDPDESQERTLRYDVGGIRTQDIEKARLLIQAAGAQEGDGRPRATLHLSPGVLHGEVIALLDELSSAGFEDFAFVANDPDRSGR